MKRKLKFIAVLVCVMLVGAAAVSFAAELKVGLILPGTVTDFGWDYSPIIALNDIEAKMSDVVVEHRYAEIVSPADAEGVMMDLISAGYNWIWAWGFQYTDAVVAVSKKVGKDIYFTINEGNPSDIVRGRIEVIEEFPEGTSYLAGIIGASVSKRGRVGGVHGMANVVMEMAEAGFEAGAKAYNPRATYKQIYVGAWGDPEGGRRAAEALLKTGIDVIFCIGDGTSLGVIEAIKQARAQKKDVYYIGCYVDQSVLAPGNVLTSVKYDYSDILMQQANDILNGRFGKGGYVIELGKGIELAPYYNFDKQIPENAKEMVARARRQIIAGSLKVPRKLK
jgi:basic membrane protein A